MANFTSEARWRDSARPVKFFIWDGSLIFWLFVWLLHMRLWTLGIAFSAMVFFSILKKFGFTLRIFCRYMRVTLVGKRKILDYGVGE